MYLYSVFMMLVFFALQVFGGSPIYISKKSTRRVGSEVELTCAIADNSKHHVEWVKLAHQNATDSQPLPEEDRISKIFDTGSNVDKLKIDNIQATDAGWYRCQIQLPNNTVTVATQLIVEQPPYILDSFRTSLTVDVGEAARLECYADGIPAPEVSWRRENNVKLPGGHSIHKGNVLEIPKVDKEDRGTYICVAANGVGNRAHGKLELQVKFAPEIQTWYRGHGQVLGKKGDLTCNVYGYPPVSIFWLKDGRQITSGGNFRISNVEPEIAVLSSTLTVNTLAAADYGDYKCKAENELGSAEKDLLLYDSTAKGVEEYYSFSGTNCVVPSAIMFLSMFFVFVRFLTSN